MMASQKEGAKRLRAHLDIPTGARVSEVADPRSEQSQRDWGLQPKVGAQRLPWVGGKSNQRQRRFG